MLGHDYAGVVEEVGTAVTKVRVGDKVSLLRMRQFQD